MRRDLTEAESKRRAQFVRNVGELFTLWEDQWLSVLDGKMGLDDVMSADDVLDEILGHVPRRAWILGAPKE